MTTTSRVTDRQETIDAFRDAVNMTADALEKWLETEDSKHVGQKHDGDRESVGHRSGRRIVTLLRQKTDFSDADLKHMKKVAGYVNRHLGQRPGGDIEETNWRFSLMNWGHDPVESA